MKTYRYILLLLPVLFLVTGCHDKDTHEHGNLKLQLNAYVGSQPLNFGSGIYNDGVSREYYFSKLKFYLSHIKLVKEDGSEVEVEDVAFFDYADNAWKSDLVNADAGTYKGIKFSVGLDPTQNSTTPTDLDDSDPLGPKDDMHWDWLKYRFVILEGTADTLGNNFAGGNIGLVYHVGRDTCYRQVSLSNGNFTVNAEGETVINLNVDLQTLFTGAGAIDMFVEPGTQSENSDLAVAIKFADRFAQTFSYSE
ncbi:MAG TPA: MbnP family protein [Chitinophagales bacterium]|nr:MbnP family protein [Chitinophagales bacterium]